MKKCKKCGEEKELTQFEYRSSGYYDCYCKPCRNIDDIQFYNYLVSVLRNKKLTQLGI